MMMAVTINAQTDSNADFLNTFWKSPYELNNHTFSLELEKIYYPGVIREILDVSDVYMIKPKPEAELRLICGTDEPWFDTYTNFQPINKSLPSIDILRNKFVIFNYPDGTSENFLLTINDSIPTDANYHYYQRFTMQFEGEETGTGNSYDSESRDITWFFYIAENEVYLGLTSNDLERLNGINPTNLTERVRRYDDYYGYQYSPANLPISSVDCNWKFSQNTSYHFVRNRTNWMDDSVDWPWLKLDSRNCYYEDSRRSGYIFLFKMVLQ